MENLLINEFKKCLTGKTSNKVLYNPHFINWHTLYFQLTENIELVNVFSHMGQGFKSP